ncbi:hypothetical protein [Agromyces terreus]|uniref:hypothetical protein n=1 Tax=Agromyces terreus TaxID=424795 RepID=UPI0031D1E1A6
MPHAAVGGHVETHPRSRPDLFAVPASVGRAPFDDERFVVAEVLDLLDADAQRRGSGERQARRSPAELDRVRQHRRHGQRSSCGVPHHELVEHAALVEAALVLRRVHPQRRGRRRAVDGARAREVAAIGAEHEQARTRQRERGLHEIEVARCERRPLRGIRAHRPPSPEAAMLLRIRR